MPPSVMQPPDRTIAQRAEALALANQARLYRAAVKRTIKDGTIRLGDVLAGDDPRLRKMKVLELVMAVRGFGDVRARKLLAFEQISTAKTVGGLSSRQRDRLVELFVSDRPVFIPARTRLVHVPAHWKAVAA